MMVHSVLCTLGVGEVTWVPTGSQRDRRKPPTSEARRKDSSQQHNQLKSLRSYCFAISVLWKLLPWIKCLKAYGPCVVRYRMGTCHLCSGTWTYEGVCVRTYTHTHTQCTQPFTKLTVFYFSPPSPCPILFWNLHCFLFLLYPHAKQSPLSVFQHIISNCSSSIKLFSSTSNSLTNIILFLFLH